MKHVKQQIFLILAFVCFVSYSTDSEARMKNIAIIATGGTISGAGESESEAKYASAKITVNSIIASVPNISKLANIQSEQLLQMGSENMNDETWIKIAKRVNELLGKRDIDGVVITHGTDTIEETAYFLNLVIRSKKPIILVGSMRPSTSLSADGPLNLYNAVAVAASDKAINKGVLIVFNDNIYAARDVSKTNTTNVATFVSSDFGPIGNVYYGKTRIYYNPIRIHTSESMFNITNLKSLPKVDIVYGYTNHNSSTIDQLVNSGTKGIIYAGVGDGNIYKDTLAKLIDVSKNGTILVRSSRVGSGFVVPNAEINDDEYKFVTADNLSPQKARILLMLSLTKTNDYKKIQDIFWNY
jgi:L-asparaginase